MRQANDGDVQRTHGVFFFKALGKGVFVLDIDAQIRHDAQNGQVRFVFKHGEAGAENFDVTAEFIDDKSLDAVALVRLQQLYGAEKLREHAAAVDVADEQNGRIDKLCEPHVHDVIRFQVDLRRAARALDDDNVKIFCKAVVGAQNIGNE